MRMRLDVNTQPLILRCLRRNRPDGRILRVLRQRRRREARRSPFSCSVPVALLVQR